MVYLHLVILKLYLSFVFEFEMGPKRLSFSTNFQKNLTTTTFIGKREREERDTVFDNFSGLQKKVLIILAQCWRNLIFTETEMCFILIKHSCNDYFSNLKKVQQ